MPVGPLKRPGCICLIWGLIGLTAMIAVLPVPVRAQAIGVIISGRAEEAAAIAAVIARIADDPGAVRSIVGAQVAATPAWREAIASSAGAAYPGFAATIAEAAGYTPPQPPAAFMAAPLYAAAPPPAAAPLPPPSIPVVAAEAVGGAPAFGAPYLAAVRLGVLAHDIGFIGSNVEDGQAIDLEIQFTAPGFLGYIWSPRPTLGGMLSTGGGTNFFYGGLNWHFEPFAQGSMFEALFFDAFFGIALHDGNSTGKNTADNKALGCDVLFREALEFGVKIARQYTLSAMVSHMSHGEILCPDGHNRGMDHLGLRLGYEF